MPELEKSMSDTAEKVERTEAEWRAALTPEQYHVLREKGTERPYTGALTENHETGDYQCAGCGAVLFGSGAKFDSGCGWPSFMIPGRLQSGRTSTKTSQLRHAPRRGHLRALRRAPGPRLPRRPAPTGLRYCINSASLTFDQRKSNCRPPLLSVWRLQLLSNSWPHGLLRCVSTHLRRAAALASPAGRSLVPSQQPVTCA
jgi:peptide-methionine (R)-S-oxide reductase